MLLLCDMRQMQCSSVFLRALTTGNIQMESLRLRILPVTWNRQATRGNKDQRAQQLSETKQRVRSR